MNAGLKKLLRTIQVHFPALLDAKFAAMRAWRQFRGVPFDADFEGIRLLPRPDGALFLDVGANRGQSTDAILLLTKNCRVQLFEPNPLLCGKLRRQFGGNSRVAINEFGLGNKMMSQPLHVPFYKRWMFDGLASFDVVAAQSWLEGRIYFYNPGHLSIHEVACEIRRLDDLDLAPFLIKIDVQGYEFEVIQGAEQTIRTHEPVLLIESPPERHIVDFLGQRGYCVYTFRNNKFICGVAEGNNAYFMTQRTASRISAHVLAS